MPLLPNELRFGDKIFIEGPDGNELIRDKPRAKVNPYGRSRRVDPGIKARAVLKKKVSRAGKGYTWTIGYNIAVGRYTGGTAYPLFSGSSLNRSLKNYSDAEILYRKRAREIALVYKMREAMFDGRTEFPLPWQNDNLFCRPYTEVLEEYQLWLSRQVSGDVDGYSFGIHMLSPRSRGKIKDKATAFYRACPGSRVFVTLTFIAPVDDKTGIDLLNKFFTVVRKNHSNVQYLWVAERQEETRNIHFHVIFNKRLPVGKYNALWVLQQYNAGLVGTDKFGQKITRERIEMLHKKKEIGKALNPFDVKRIQSIGGLSSYLTKYITKQKKNVPFNCSVWHCTRGVSRLFSKTTVAPSVFRYCMSLANCRVDKKTGEIFEARAVVKQFSVAVFINNKSVPLTHLKEMETINKWIIQGMQPDKLPQCDDELYSKYFCNN